MAKSVRSRKISRKSAAKNVAAPEILAITYQAEKQNDNVQFFAETSQSDDAQFESDETFSVATLGNETFNEKDVRDAYNSELAYSLRDRVNIELDRNASVAKKYTQYAREILLDSRVLDVFFDARVTPDFATASSATDKYFNEKATDRMIDVARFMAKPERYKCCEYTKAIVKTALNFYLNDLALTSDVITACMSGERHAFSGITGANIVQSPAFKSAGTVAAQKSMTLNALVKFNVLFRARSGKSDIYKFNPESFASKRLCELLNLA